MNIEDKNILELYKKTFKVVAPISTIVLGLLSYFVFLFTTNRRGALARFRNSVGLYGIRNNSLIWFVFILIFVFLCVSNVLYLIIHYFLEKKTNKLNEYEKKIMDTGFFSHLSLYFAIIIFIFLIVLYCTDFFRSILQLINFVVPRRFHIDLVGVGATVPRFARFRD